METFKIVVIGDAGTGKSSFIDRMNNKNFITQYSPTFGVVTQHVERENIAYDFLDTGGQEKYNVVENDYYASADVAVIMFDASSSLTHKNIPKWIEIFRSLSNAPIFVVMNKSDLEYKNTSVLRNLNRTIHCISSMKNTGINSLMLNIERKLLNAE